MIVRRLGNSAASVLCLISLGLMAWPSSLFSQQPQPQPQPQQQQPQQPQQPPQPQQRQQPQQQEQPQQQQQQQDLDIAAAPDEAQQVQPQWNAVRVIRVKGDRVGEFEALLKELGAAMAEANQPGFNVLEVELGALNTYHIVGQLESFGAFEQMQPPMEPARMATWLNRIESTIESHEFMIARMHPDLSIEPAAQGGQPPELMLLMIHTVMPGRSQEYQTWLRDEVLPALRQADIAGFFANELSLGAKGRTWVFAVPIRSWSEFDQPSPLHRALGEHAAEELMRRGDEMIEEAESMVLHMRADLSTAGGGL